MDATIQNGIALNPKSILTKVDTTPTADSNNPVSSDGVKTYVDQKDQATNIRVDTLNTQIAASFFFKGSSTFAELPASGNTVNDTYYVTDSDKECWYSWNGTDWIKSSMSQADYAGLIAQLKADVSAEYSTSKTYKVGDYCLYGADGVLYICKIAVTTAGAFDSNKWQAISFGEAVGDLVIADDTQPTSLANKIWLDTDPNPDTVEVITEEDLGNIVAGEFDSASAYAVGDYCIHDAKLYVAKTATAVNDGWIAARWQQVTVMGTINDQVGELKTQIDDLTELCVKENSTVWSDDITTSAGTAIQSSKHLVDVNIDSGKEYKIQVVGNGNLNKFALYANGASIKTGCVLNEEYTFTATEDITYFSMYATGTNVTGSGTITTVVSVTEINENSLEARVEDLETSDVALEGKIDAVGNKANGLYAEYILIPGNNVLYGWELGDINTTTGEDVETSDYYRTGKIAVNQNTYYMYRVKPSDDEENVVYSQNWTSDTYAIVLCYSESTYLGIATISNNQRILPNGTTHIRIAHALNYSPEQIGLYKRENDYPSGHDNVVSETFNTSKISEIKIDEKQINFTKISSVCIINKDSVSPWYRYNNNIKSNIVPFEPGTYKIEIAGTGQSYTTYIMCLDETKNQIAQINISNYDAYYNVPDGTRYVVFMIYGALLTSDITTFNVYRRSVSAFGSDTLNKKIDADTLPSLPPLALTGQAAGGIISLGHGGQSSIYAEDSIESFYGLARSGYAGTEIDIQFTKDHVPVCWHNPTLSVLSGGTDNDHIYDYTLEELDSTFDFRTWWNTSNYLRPTVARFEEVCILARAYGWWLLPDKMQDATETDFDVLINLIKKYKLDEKMILAYNYTYLRSEFPNAPLCLTAQESVKDDAWMNTLLQNYIPEHCHVDSNQNNVVDSDYNVYISFNWKTIKDNDGLQGCVDTTELCLRHNVKLIWYTVETPEDIYQLVSNCPSTEMVLTGLYTIPDGVNEYLNIKWSNRKYGLNGTIEV